MKKTIAAYGFTAGQVGSMTPAEIAGLFPDGANELKDALASARDAITSATDRRSESRRRQEELIVTALARGLTKRTLQLPPASRGPGSIRPIWPRTLRPSVGHRSR